MSRHEVLGVPYDCVSMSQAIDRVAGWLSSGTRAHTIVAANPEKVMKARSSEHLRAFLGTVDLLIPDGIGLVWASRLFGSPARERVTGVDLMLELCSYSARSGTRVFLFGAAPEVNASAATNLQRMFPGLVVAGVQHGFVSEDDMTRVVDSINASRAQILFVALGSPRQENWMAHHLPKMTSVRACQGVGGSFDVLSGAVRRAPTLFRALGTEWAFRLASNPRRAHRQLALPAFAWHVLREAARRRRKHAAPIASDQAPHSDDLSAR